MKPDRRDRTMLGIAGGVLLLAVVIAILTSSGGGNPRYVPSGAGIATVLTPRRPAGTPRHAPHIPPFQPTSVAVSTAAKLPLARQVAQLFMVEPDASLAGVDQAAQHGWGGIVLDQIVTGVLPEAIAAWRADGNLAPLLAFNPASSTPGGVGVHGVGFNMVLAPPADVDTPGGALSGRLLSSDPVTVAQLAASAIAQYEHAGLIPAVGHFPGEGSASADPDQMPATVGGSLTALGARDLVPFTTLVARAPVIVMSNAAYAAFDGVTPAGLLSAAVSLLRHTYGFQGVVMTDDLDAAIQATGQDPGTAAVQALQAGDDLLYISGSPAEQAQAYSAVLAAAQRHSAVRARVRDALLRVLSLKSRFGLLV